MLLCMPKKSSRLWIFCVVVTCLLGNTAAKGSVAITCVECGKDGKDTTNLVGEEKKNLTIRFTIVSEGVFFSLTVKYNTSSVTINNVKVIKEKTIGRLHVSSKKPSKQGNTYTITIILSNLSLESDNDRFFTYALTDVDGVQPEVKSQLKVTAVPQFVEPPNQKYTIEENTKKFVSFTIRGNPAPKKVTAKVGDVDLTVLDITTPTTTTNSTPTYRFHYKVEIVMNREQCGDTLLVEVTPENGKNVASVISELQLKFEPEVVKNVEVSRTKKHLKVAWDRLVYGNCKVMYHVKYLNNNSLHAEIVRTADKQMEFDNAVGNITVSVNAEVNGKEGSYSEKVSIAATAIPKVPSGKKKDDEDKSMTTIIGASVAGAILIIVIIIAVLLLMRKKKKTNRDPEYHRDMEPIAYQANHVDNDYTYIDNLVAPKTQPQQTIYAELGPGGGNIGRKPLPQQSNYAEVKTEGIHYPDLQQTSPRHPPEYGIASRNRPQQSQENTYDQVSMDDYESSVVV